MDLKTIREELSHLESLVDGWRSDAGIPALERDLALGMLRRLYECVRFGAEEVLPQAAAEPVAAEMPESIDLAEVLAFKPVAVVPEPFPSSNEEQAEADRLLDAGSAGIAAADSVSDAEPDAAPATAGADADDAAQTVLAAEEAESSVSAEDAAASADEESEAETAEVVAAAVDEEPAEEPSEVSEPSDKNTEPHRPAEEPAEPVVIAAEPASVSPVAKAEEQAAPQPEPVCEEQTAAPASPDTAAEPATPAAEMPAAEHAAVEHRGGGARRPLMGSLFGVEEPVVRHRHRQRVIMSLYGDTEPAVSERLSGAGTVRHAAPAPAERRMAEMPAETLRHDEAGQPAAAPEVTAPAAGETVAADAAMPADAAAAERMPAADPVGETATVEAQPVASESPSPSLRAETAEAEVDGAGAGETVPEQYAEEEENPFVEVQLDAVGDDASEPVSEEPVSEESEPEEPVGEKPGTSGNVPTAGPFVQSPVAAESGAVLGEVINHDVRTLADTIAPPRDMASEIARSEPVTDLRRAIGINDRFLMIRDLFGGDADAYEQAITELDGFHDLDECMIYIAENFAWNSSSDGARFLMELLERKYA